MGWRRREHRYIQHLDSREFWGATVAAVQQTRGAEGSVKTLAHEGSAARAGALAKLASACEHAAAALDHLMASELRQAVTAASQSHPALGEGGGGDDGDGAEEEVVTSQATAAEQERPQGAITPMEVEMAAVPGGFRQQQGGGGAQPERHSTCGAHPVPAAAADRRWWRRRRRR
eukprot:COSAG01_NODE_6339_length_3727_cov_75.463408_2_plen_174_part_00